MYFFATAGSPGEEKRKNRPTAISTTANEHCYLSHLEAMSVVLSDLKPLPSSYHEQQHQVSLLEELLSPSLQTAQFCFKKSSRPLYLTFLILLAAAAQTPQKQDCLKGMTLHFFTNISEKLIRYVYSQQDRHPQKTQHHSQGLRL